MQALRAVRRGFTLLELLVVVGIITVLLAILLPALSKVEETARRTQCASNLRQVALAFNLYCVQNRNHLPAPAWVLPDPADWVYWQSNRKLNESPVVSLLGSAPERVLRCPSDNLSVHKVWWTGPDPPYEPYPFSYLFNVRFKMRRVNLPALSNLIMLVEGDEKTIASGRWDPTLFAGPHSWEDLVGTRHDARRWTNWPNADLLDYPSRPDRNDRGNVAFFDTHVAFVSRAFTFSPPNFLPPD